MATRYIGVGSQLHRWWIAASLWPHSRCRCKEVAALMDQTTPKSIRANIDHWTVEVSQSTEEWVRGAFLPELLKEKVRERMTPENIQAAILKACDVVEARQITVLRPGELDKMNRDGKGEITVCITYYKRPHDLRRMFESVPRSYPLLVQDTGGNLSWARNQLIQRCQTQYALIVEEDMEWTDQTRPELLADVLESDDAVVFAAGRVGDGRTQWHHNFKRDPNPSGWPSANAYASQEEWLSTSRGTLYQRCDLVKNFGVVRTDFAAQLPWNEQLPLSEHHDWFWRLAQDHRAGYVPQCLIKHYSSRPNPEYEEERRRAWPLAKAGEAHHRMLFPEPAESSDHTNIVVLGVARSNTSVTAAAIHTCGWHVGMVQRGKCENLRVIGVNERLINSGEWSHQEAAAVLDDLRQPWLVKDPRFAETLDRWYPAFAKYQPLLVYLKRRHDAVEQSWRRLGRPYKQITRLREGCERFYDEWPWHKVALDVELIGKAAAMFDPTYLEEETNGSHGELSVPDVRSEQSIA